MYPFWRNVHLIISPFLIELFSYYWVVGVLYIFWIQIPYQINDLQPKLPSWKHLQWAYPYLVTSCKSRTWILLDELLIFCSIRERKTISSSSSVTELQKHDNFHVMKWFTCWSSLISCEVKCTLWGFTSSIAKGLPGSTHPVMKQKRVDGVNIWANARGLGGVKKRVELYRTESLLTWLHLGEGRMCEKNQGAFWGLLNPRTGNM